jgi:glucuronokinase
MKFSLDFPQIILDIEREELGIAAGLQDRVIQTYGGIVHMDFTSLQTEAKGVYTPLDPSMLPELYLLYNTEEGGDSGKVHSTAKSRWLNGDPVVVAGHYPLPNVSHTVIRNASTWPAC